MCDSCIIQLNVAYNLKKNAIQSDLKLRQYMIEFGINVTSYTTCSINTVSVIRPPAMLMPSTTTSESVTITTAKSTTVAQQSPVAPLPPRPHQPFPVMPVIIKEEPIDYEEMSDITVETNTEAFEDHRNGTDGIQSTPSTSASSNKSTTPLPLHSMVSVSRKSLMLASKESTDSEYISTYVRRSSVNSERSKNSRTKTANKPVAPSKPSPKSRKSKPPTTPRPNTNKKDDKLTPTRTKKTDAKTPSAKLNREVKSLFNDSINKNDSAPKQPKRLTRQQQSSLGMENIQHKSRSRSGVLPKADYKSFFFLKTASPLNNGKAKLVRRMSVDSIKRNAKSPNPKNLAKSRYAGNIRQRRTSMSHRKTSIWKCACCFFSSQNQNQNYFDSAKST